MLSRLLLDISENLPEIGKALFQTLIKALHLKSIEKYLKKASERYVRNGH